MPDTQSAMADISILPNGSESYLADVPSSHNYNPIPCRRLLIPTEAVIQASDHRRYLNNSYNRPWRSGRAHAGSF